MPALPFGVSLNLSPLDDIHECYFANALAQARNWHEETAQGLYWRDSLASPRLTGTQQGLPQQLDAGIVAVTYCRVTRPGTWHVIWEGQADVGISHAGTNRSASNMGQGGQRSFTFDRNPADPFVRVQITLTAPADSIRNFRIVHSSDTSGTAWQGLSSAFVARMAALRPSWLRLMNWFSPNHPNSDGWTETWTQWRPDTWWTQSDVWLDVWTVSGASWSLGPPTLGERIEYRDGGGGVIASGRCVRIGASSPGVLAHVKVDQVSGQIATAATARVQSTGSTTTITDAPRFWQPRTMGPSFEALMMLLGGVPGLTGLAVTAPFSTQNDWHSGFATAWLADPRTTGKKIAVEKGNEGWNPSGPFNKTHSYCNDQGTAAGLPGPNPWERGAQWILWRAKAEWQEWSTRFATAGRAADFYRYLCWQNAASNDYWYGYATVINPDDEPGPYPREVVQIDVLGTAPYIGDLEGWTASQALAATDQDLLNELLNSVQTRIVVSAGYWNGKAAARAPDQGGVPCGYLSYEWGQHIAPNGLIGWGSLSQSQQQQLVTKLQTFQGGAHMAAAYAAAALQMRNGGAPFCAYDDVWTWGEYGFWAHTPDPWQGDGTPNVTSPRFLMLVREQSLTVHQAEYPDAEHHVLLTATVAQLVQAPIRSGRGAAWQHQVELAATEAELIPVTRHLGIGASWNHLVELQVTDPERIGAPIVHIGSGARVLIEVRLEPTVWIHDLGPEPVPSASWEHLICLAPTHAEKLIRVPHEAQGAGWTVSVGLGATEANHDTRGGSLMGPRNLHGWTALKVRRLRKRRNLILWRGSLVSWALHSDDDSIGTMVFPLRVGEKFAGIVVDTAIAGEEFAWVSQTGTCYVDIEGLQESDADVPIAATDDQQLRRHDASIPSVLVGRGYRDPNTFPALTYEAVELRSLDDTNAPQGGGDLPPQPPI